MTHEAAIRPSSIQEIDAQALLILNLLTIEDDIDDSL
jgi:hypothetical protein